jgi:hypothetical protein
MRAEQADTASPCSEVLMVSRFASSFSSPLLSAALCLGCLPLPLACGDDDHGHDDGGADHDDGHDEEGPVGPASGADCPDDAGMLTYEDFGQPFMEAYCTRCHSSELSGDARNSAPEGHDFDTLEGILLVGDHVDQMAAAGPASTNATMPPSDPKPTMEEREKLGQWLACELGN